MLRQGVTWHDGKAFTAKDVVCTFDLINGSREGARKSPRKVWYDNVEKVLADDALRVTFHLGDVAPPSSGRPTSTFSVRASSPSAAP